MPFCFCRLSFLVVFFAGCMSVEDSKNSQKDFFDIEGYFLKESQRLTRKDAILEKTVSHNGIKEQKTLKVKDWETELKLFTNSDINKPAWKKSYQIRKSGNKIEYLAADKSLRTRKIDINLSESGNVKYISIYNLSSNALYSSVEELHYYPDSLYTIKKHQSVKITGQNIYQISGRIKNL